MKNKLIKNLFFLAIIFVTFLFFHFSAQNVLAGFTVTINVVTLPSSDQGKFNIDAGPNTPLVTNFNNGTAGQPILGNGENISESAGIFTNLSDYSISYECTNGPSGSGSSFALTNAADGMICTFTNTNKNFLPTATPVTLTATPAPTATPTVSSSNDSSTNSNSSNTSSTVCSNSRPGSAPFLKSAVASKNSVTLNWNEASSPVSYYLVAYGTSSGSQTYGNPNVGGSGTTSYTVYGLSIGTKYYFRVRAGNGCAPGDFSNELSAVPTGDVTSTPDTGLTPGVLGDATPEATITMSVTQIPQVKGAETSNDDSFFSKYLWYIIGFFLIQIAIFIYYENRFYEFKKTVYRSLASKEKV